MSKSIDAVTGYSLVLCLAPVTRSCRWFQCIAVAVTSLLIFKVIILIEVCVLIWCIWKTNQFNTYVMVAHYKMQFCSLLSDINYLMNKSMVVHNFFVSKCRTSADFVLQIDLSFKR